MKLFSKIISIIFVFNYNLVSFAQDFRVKSVVNQGCLNLSDVKISVKKMKFYPNDILESTLEMDFTAGYYLNNGWINDVVAHEKSINGSWLEMEELSEIIFKGVVVSEDLKVKLSDDGASASGSEGKLNATLVISPIGWPDKQIQHIWHYRIITDCENKFIKKMSIVLDKNNGWTIRQ